MGQSCSQDSTACGRLHSEPQPGSIMGCNYWVSPSRMPCFPCPCHTMHWLALQADGSGMYSLQGLWTQEREGLHVVTLVCANRAYSILKVEMARERITPR